MILSGGRAAHDGCEVSYNGRKVGLDGWVDSIPWVKRFFINLQELAQSACNTWRSSRGMFMAAALPITVAQSGLPTASCHG